MTVKIIVLALYIGVLFFIGWLASRRIKNMGDYYVGGKNISFWGVAFSARATGESGWLLLGLTGMGALAGLSAYWVVVGEVLGVAASWFFMAKRFKLKSDLYDSMTVPDYLESHFKSKTHLLRIVSALVLSVFVVIYVSSQIDATGKAFESFLNIKYHYGALIGFGIVMAYIFIGGFVAVVWSDMFQGVLMFLGLVTLPIVAYFSMSGDVGIVEQLNAIDPKLTNIWGNSNNPWMNAATLLGFSMIGLGFLGAPQVYVRFMSISGVDELVKGRRVAIAFTLLTDFAAVSIGILARIFFTTQGQDAEAVLGTGGENVLSMMTEQFLPLIIVALYVAIVLSAIMSTIDSLLVIASSAVTRDFYQKVFHPDIADDKLTNMSRWVTLSMAFLALGFSFLLAYLYPDRQIFWTIIFGWSGIAATFCPVMILSLYWKGTTEAGAIASMLTGFVSVAVVKFVLQEMETIGPYFKEIDVLFPSFVAAFTVGVVVSLLTKKN